MNGLSWPPFEARRVSGTAISAGYPSIKAQTQRCCRETQSRGSEKTLTSFLPHLPEIGRSCESALFAVSPELSKPLNILSVKLPFPLPIPKRLANDLAGRGVLSGFHGGIKRS